MCLCLRLHVNVNVNACRHVCVLSGRGQTKAGVPLTNQLKRRKNGGGRAGPAGFTHHLN